MTRPCSYSKRLLYSIALLLTGFVAACGGGGQNTPTTNPALGGTVVTPVVVSTTPADIATAVPINRKITATFNEAMNPATITATTTTFTVTGPGNTTVPGAVTYVAAGTAAIFTPTSSLIASTLYTATITTAAKDASGNALASNKTWSFTTGPTTDTTAPTVRSTAPVDTATAVPTNRKVYATFDKAMDPATLTTATFTVTGPGNTTITGAVTYAGTTAIFSPTTNLAINALFTAVINTGAKDLAGNPLATNKTWSFTTGATQAANPGPVVLGTAGNFVILAQSGISTTGTTAIVGDLGLSPMAATGITGFNLTLDGASGAFATSSLVTGKVYAADYAAPTPVKMTTAIGDMGTAYTDAAGRTLPDFTELGAGDISGMTLAPGLYKWGTGVLATSDVTLNGGANDVWIFQIAQGLTVNNGVHIILSGGALPKNIFWQVAGQATLGTTADFQGIILSKTAIVFNTGAKMHGRALAQTAVTLDSNAITQPAP